MVKKEVELDNGRNFEVVKLTMGEVHELLTGTGGEPITMSLGVPDSFLKYAVKEVVIDEEDLEQRVGFFDGFASKDDVPFEDVSDFLEAFERVNPSVPGRIDRMVTLI